MHFFHKGALNLKLAMSHYSVQYTEYWSCLWMHVPWFNTHTHTHTHTETHTNTHTHTHAHTHTHKIYPDAHSLALGGYELHSHIYTHSIIIPFSIPKCNTMFHYFQPSHTPLCVKDSYGQTHTVNNSDHKTNMPRCVWFSFYLFRSYNHHMSSILTPAHPKHCSFVRPCR